MSVASVLQIEIGDIASVFLLYSSKRVFPYRHLE